MTSGARVLSEHDFLGPIERKKIKIEAIKKELAKNTLVDKSIIAPKARTRHLAEADNADYSHFYRQVEMKLLDDRRSNIKANVFRDVEEREKKTVTF